MKKISAGTTVPREVLRDGRGGGRAMHRSQGRERLREENIHVFTVPFVFIALPTEGKAQPACISSPTLHRLVEFHCSKAADRFILLDHGPVEIIQEIVPSFHSLNMMRSLKSPSR